MHHVEHADRVPFATTRRYGTVDGGVYRSKSKAPSPYKEPQTSLHQGAVQGAIYYYIKLYCLYRLHVRVRLRP